MAMNDDHLQNTALELLLENIQSISYDVKEIDINSPSAPLHEYMSKKHSSSTINPTVNYTWPATCSSPACAYVQESTTTLLFARALVKANRTDDAWASLRSLFSVQGFNGYLPKYRYFNSTAQNDDSEPSPSYFYDDTNIPKLETFGLGSVPSRYQPCPSDQIDSSSTCLDSSSEYTYVNEVGIKGSGRLSALPMHSTTILEIFYLSNQTASDIKQLEFYFERLYKLHLYWMEQVIQRCALGPNEPCYNIIHPWESLVDISSPQWKHILGGIDDLIKETGWTPRDGYHSIRHDVDEGIHNSMMYLTECQANATTLYNTTTEDLGDYERQIIKLCPFAMLDIGHLAVLSRSNHDLREIGNILHDFHSRKGPTKSQSSMLQEWIRIADELMEKHLWDDSVHRYRSRNLHFIKNTSATSTDDDYPYTFDFNSSSFVNSSASANLMACWNTMEDSSRMMDSIVSPILQHDDIYSYNCAPYPISSSACNAKDNADTVNNETIRIEPLMNYLISMGLKHNKASYVGDYISMSTIKMMCSDHDDNGTCTNVSSANVYTYPLQPLNISACDNSSTVSRAVLYNILTPDKPFSYVPSPPMRNSWVIVLIVAEIMVAFGVELSCFLLSFNLMQKLKNDAEEENLLRLAREQNARIGSDDYEPLVGGDEIEQGVNMANEEPFPVLLWRFIKHVNPFKARNNLEVEVPEEM